MPIMKTRITLLLVAMVCPSQMQAQAPGSLDTAFQAQLPTNFVSQPFGPIAVQPDGKIIVGGEYYRRGFDPDLLGPRFLARLNPDGSLDASFNPTGIRSLRGAPDTYVFSSIAVQSDGKIVLGGERWEVPELGQSGLARLNRDGSVDGSFPPAPGGWFVWKLVLLPSGGYLVAGSGETTGYTLFRLKHNGELDSAFVPQILGADPDVRDFAVQPDGRIVVRIFETLIDGQKRNVIRLLPDGSYDPSFAPVLTNGDVVGFGTLPDGKILLWGEFSTVNGMARPWLARLHADGRLDLNFVPITEEFDKANLAIQRDGKIILLQYGKVNGSPAQLVRLNTDGRRDETYVSGLRNAQRVYAPVPQPDEKLLVSSVDASGVSIIRLHGDGAPYIVPVSIRPNSNGTIEFQITAATNRTVVVESSPNLKSGPWTMLATFPPGVGRETIQFSDSGSTNTQQRFYRAVSP